MVTFRGSTHISRSPRVLRHLAERLASLRMTSNCSIAENALYLTVNGVEAYTLLALCRLARGIAFLRVGALSAAGASSLSTPGKEHVSRLRHILLYLLNSTIPTSRFDNPRNALDEIG